MIENKYLVKNNTICYIFDNKKCLMMKRTKEPFLGYYLPPGGKVEKNEDPLMGIIREVKEETGLIINDPDCKAIITIEEKDKENQVLYVFFSYTYVGKLKDCNEGELSWISVEDILKHNINILETDKKFFSLIYESNNKLPMFIHIKCENNMVTNMMVNNKKYPNL